MSDRSRMTGHLCRAALALAAFAAVRTTAGAQTTACSLPQGNNKTCTTNDMVISMTIPKATMLTLTNSATFPNNDVKAADYNAGFKAAGTVSFVAKTNAPANVTLTSSAPAAFSGYVWSTDGGATFNSPATLLSIAGPTNGTTPKTVNLRTKLVWGTDAAGSYTETLTFTVTAP
jgi:hypothetical protein